MRLRLVEIEHFACLRRANVSFGPGLNVLFGPNDLGKSTLARAIRAALLLPHTSAVAHDFVEWDSDEHPSVKLTIELPDRRIWRIEKRFGASGGASILRESTDGETFSPYKKAREVDDEVRTALGWGIAAPATKGAPRGLPTSFLATVLLGEQTDVRGVLAQTIEADSDETGRVRLTQALAAFAQDPQFKRILEEAQAHVDLAFTSKGGRKRGKASPFREATDEVKRVREEFEQLARRVEESEGARRELEACHEELVRRQEARQRARDALEACREARAQREARERAEAELAVRRDALLREEAEVAALKDREWTRAQVQARLEEAATARAARAAERAEKAAAEKAAEEAVRRAKSDEAEQARRLRHSELERRALELEASTGAIDAERARASKARALHDELERSRARVAALADATARDEEGARAADEARDRVARALEVADVAARVRQRRRVQASIAELEALRAEAIADRALAEEHRARARALRERVDDRVPDAAALEGLRALAHELEVAEAKLGGGLAVVVERLRAVGIEATADGAPIEASVEGSVTFDASRTVTIAIGDVARVTVTAGERAAREHEAALRARWHGEVEPLLARLGVPDLASVVALAEHAASSRGEASEAERAATGLDERAALREERLASLDALREEGAALARELAGALVEEAEALLDALGATSLDAHRAALERERAAAQASHEEAQARAHAASVERQVLRERVAATEASLAELGIARPEAGWDRLEAELAARARELEGEGARVAAERASLAAEEGAEVERAQAALAACRATLAAIDRALAAADEALEALRAEGSRLDGEIALRREAVAGLDVAAAARRVAEAEARLDALPVRDRRVGELEIEEAERQLAEAEHEYDRAQGARQTAQGALQTVGGQVVVEAHDAARDALRQAERREREVELEYDAWRLLVEKLREAEDTEGQHLGEALSKPVTRRFSELTGGRYGKLEVGPSLHADGVRVAGVLRDVRAFSVGTQEQLATLLRLTIAEQLGSALVLDDHLTQTDPARSAWFRDVLRAHASKAQVIVLTCRPEDYLRSDDMPAAGEASASRAGGLVRAVDLTHHLERGGAGKDDAAPASAPRGS